MSIGANALMGTQERSWQTKPQDQGFNLGELTADKSKEFRPGNAPLPRPPGSPPPTDLESQERFPRMTVQVRDSPLPVAVTVQSLPAREEVRADVTLPVEPLGGKLEAIGAYRRSPMTDVATVDTGARFTMRRAGDKDLSLNVRASLINSTNMATDKTTQNLLVETRVNAGPFFAGADFRRRTDIADDLNVDKYIGVKTGDTTISVRSRGDDKPGQQSLRVENPNSRFEVVKNPTPEGDAWSVLGSARWKF